MNTQQLMKALQSTVPVKKNLGNMLYFYKGYVIAYHNNRSAVAIKVGYDDIDIVVNAQSFIECIKNKDEELNLKLLDNNLWINGKYSITAKTSDRFTLSKDTITKLITLTSNINVTREALLNVFSNTVNKTGKGDVYLCVYGDYIYIYNTEISSFKTINNAFNENTHSIIVGDDNANSIVGVLNNSEQIDGLYRELIETQYLRIQSLYLYTPEINYYCPIATDDSMVDKIMSKVSKIKVFVSDIDITIDTKTLKKSLSYAKHFSNDYIIIDEKSIFAANDNGDITIPISFKTKKFSKPTPIDYNGLVNILSIVKGDTINMRYQMAINKWLIDVEEVYYTL